MALLRSARGTGVGGRRPRSRRGASGTGGSGPALRPPGRPRAPLPRRRGGRWGAPAGRGRGAPPRPAVRPGSQPRGASACRPSPSPGPPSAHWIRRGPCPWFSGSRRGARGGVGAGPGRGSLLLPLAGRSRHPPARGGAGRGAARIPPRGARACSALPRGSSPQRGCGGRRAPRLAPGTGALRRPAPGGRRCERHRG